MAEGEGAPSNKTLNLVANGMLAFSGFWGLQSAQERPIIGAAFALYAAKGLFGVLQEMLGPDEFVDNLAKEVDILVSHIGIPLITAEITEGVRYVQVLDYFLLPLISFLGQEGKVQPRVLAASHGFCLGLVERASSERFPALYRARFARAFLGAMLAQLNLPKEISNGLFTFGIYSLYCALLLDDDNIKKGAELSSKMACHFGIPLITTEITKEDCVPVLPTMVEYFLIPVIDFFGEELGVELDKRMLATSHGFCLGSALACVGGKDAEPMRGGFVHSFLASLFSQGNLAEEYTTLLVALAVYLTWATVNNKLPKF